MSFSGEFKTFVTQRAMGEIFNQLMELIAPVGIDISPGMQGETIHAETEFAFSKRGFLVISKSEADTRYKFSSIGTKGDFASNRGSCGAS